MINIQRLPGLVSVVLVGAVVGCGNAGGATSTGAGGGSISGGPGGSDSTGSSNSASSGASGAGGGGSGDTSVDAKVPSGTIAFSGGAAAHYINASKTDLQIVINEGGASCVVGADVSKAGQHEFELDLVGVAGTSPPYAAMTYTDTNGASTSVHAEGYIYTPCGNLTVAGAGGEWPFSVTITSIDATQVTGTFTMTLTEHIPGGKQFPASGSFVAPICDHGITPTCN